jgi:hypothetical protein
MRVQSLFIALFIASFCAIQGVLGATWYIRADGGARDECTGLTDAPFPGGMPNHFTTTSSSKQHVLCIKYILNSINKIIENRQIEK